MVKFLLDYLFVVLLRNILRKIFILKISFFSSFDFFIFISNSIVRFGYDDADAPRSAIWDIETVTEAV